MLEWHWITWNITLPPKNNLYIRFFRRSLSNLIAFCPMTFLRHFSGSRGHTFMSTAISIQPQLQRHFSNTKQAKLSSRRLFCFDYGVCKRSGRICQTELYFGREWKAVRPTAVHCFMESVKCKRLFLMLAHFIILGTYLNQRNFLFAFTFAKRERRVCTFLLNHK